MDEQQGIRAQFPHALVDWAGNHAGGVKRLFDRHSGRPAKDLLKTNLLVRLEGWAGRTGMTVEEAARWLAPLLYTRRYGTRSRSAE